MPGGGSPPALHYQIRPTPSGGFNLQRGAARAASETPASLIWEFDRDVIVEVQRQRSDLYFVHAAVLEMHQRAVAIIAPSGTGKSTLAWALLHRGFRYLSDELAPIDLAQLRVTPFPRALCLKDPPPAPFGLPERTLATDDALHVSVDLLPSAVCSDPLLLSSVFFLRRDPGCSVPNVTRLDAADAAQRVYVNSLNPLAHDSAGLTGAIRVASGCSCYELMSADPASTAALVSATVRSMQHPTS